jgi:hypothetical protein
VEKYEKENEKKEENVKKGRKTKGKFILEG